MGDEEKQFIETWISLNKGKRREECTYVHKNDCSDEVKIGKFSEGTIQWIILRENLKNEFGRYRSENAIKNHWYSKLRSQGKAQKVRAQEGGVQKGRVQKRSRRQTLSLNNRAPPPNTNKDYRYSISFLLN